MRSPPKPWPDLWARLFARLLELAEDRLEARYADEKRRLLADLTGVVLELGPGAGANFRYLPPGIAWIGVEPNRHLHARLLRRAGARPVELLWSEAERLDLVDGSVDAVVCTLVLCSVRDQASVLREVRRVLKPGGRFVFLEHVAAPRGTCLRRLQHAVAPLWSLVGHGCRPDRETWATLDEAGFEHLEYRHLRMPGMALASPHVSGCARGGPLRRPGPSACGPSAEPP